MAFPVSNWSEWSQPSIEPFMEAVIHFPNEDVVLTDHEISNVNITARMFDSSSILFGPPEPATASLEIIDYAQAFNPVLNSNLVENVQIDFYLGLWPLDSSQLPVVGTNLVSSFDQPILVEYQSVDCWATIIHVTPGYLQPTKRYRLEYTYQLYGSNELITESFVVPTHWFERHIYAITLDTQYTVFDVKIYEIQALIQPYGVFFSQEWSYDTVSHTATVDLIDSMNEVLSLDNRASAELPSAQVSLKAFVQDFLQLYDANTSLINNYSDEPLRSFDSTLDYSFYESSQKDTINSMIPALMACYFFLPDGSAALCQPTGAFDPDITLTDDDIETYDISQTSSYAYDSIVVDYYSTSLVQKVLRAVDDYKVNTSWQTLLFDTARLYEVDYIQYTGFSNTVPNPIYYEWSSAEVHSLLAASNPTSWLHFEAVGQCVEGTSQQYSLVEGSSEYHISSNMYIQNLTHAITIYNLLDTFRQDLFNTISVTLRGCFAFWPGALVLVRSHLYNIWAVYVIVGIDFSYDGAVHTTLTLQKRVQ